jgi:thiamine-phosphate pyrophosphorylase
MLLYYITDRKGFPGGESQQRTALLGRIADVARAGVDYIQLREKDLPGIDLANLVRLSLNAVRDNSAQTKLLVNSHADIALAVGADGVHLPAGSQAASEVRNAWSLSTNREILIGVSAHSITDVQQAESAGADFAVLAPIFEKFGIAAKGIGLNVLRDACVLSHKPVLALGGVNLINARACLDAGAAGVAGIRLFQRGDVAETVRRLRAL